MNRDELYKPMREAQRKEICMATLRCFAKNGIAKTKMADIYREADISSKTLYKYFKSKVEVINYLIETEIRNFQEQVNGIEAENAREFLKMFLESSSTPDISLFEVVNVVRAGEAITSNNHGTQEDYKTLFVSREKILAEKLDTFPSLDSDISSESMANIVLTMLWGMSITHQLVGLDIEKTLKAAQFIIGAQKLQTQKA